MYDKCIVKSKSCNFFGNIYTPEVVKPYPSKVHATKKKGSSSTKQELQLFLGMVCYISSSILHMSDLKPNLRDLLKKDFLFQWTKTHETELQSLKKPITKDANPQYYNPKKPVILHLDIS